VKTVKSGKKAENIWQYFKTVRFFAVLCQEKAVFTPFMGAFYSMLRETGG